jgi:hypothetical protein
VNEEYSVMYRYNGSSVAGRSFYFIGGYANNYFVTADLIPALYEDFKLNTVTSTYSTNISDSNTKGILNGTYIPPLSPGTAPLNTGLSFLRIGNHPNESPFECSGFEISSIRLYNCVLSSEEIQYNAELDQKRYLAPPMVKIGNKECSEVVVLSPNLLMCKVPPSEGNASGLQDVVVTGSNGETITSVPNGYTYVDNSSFYISNISSIIGGAGKVITFTGNKLDEITEVKAGGKVWTIQSKTPTTCICKLPDDLGGLTGEVDIMITVNGTEYRFARMFEYRE